MKEFNFHKINKKKNNFDFFNKSIFLLKLLFVNLITIKAFTNLNNYYSEINFVIQGKGEDNILGREYNITTPFEVFVNGIKNNSCNKTCFLDKEKNSIVLRFEQQIESCEFMFGYMSKIIEMDLSNFDFSKVKTMNAMFFSCLKLKKIFFGNINTSSVKNMRAIFSLCYELTSVDISNFDTSNVINMAFVFHECKKLEMINFGNMNTSLVLNMYGLFDGCETLIFVDVSCFDTSKVKDMTRMFALCRKLRFLDLSNFNTLNVESINMMFYNCKSLIFLNLGSFKFDNLLNKEGFTKEINLYTKYCTKDEETNFNSLLNINIDCNHECFKENTRIDINNNCIGSCFDNGYKFNYNILCYNECPNNTYPLFCEGDNCDSNNNSIECFGITPEGYYLDISNKTYKKCYENCKFCYGEGNETINNCSVCLSHLGFLNEEKYKTNCFSKCNSNENYFDNKTNYYYFDELNEYHCTKDYICPEKYNKIIIDKKKCIDECKNDDTYKFEFNNFCYQKCPYKTKQENINYICVFLENSPDMFFDSLKNSILNNTFDYSNLEIQDKILDEIRKFFKNGFDTINIDKGNDVVLNIDKVNYTITTPQNQKNNENNYNVTTINLIECEKKLRKQLNISKNNNLYILKVDTLINNIRKVEYELYYRFNNKNFTNLDLSICKNIKTDILIPLEIPLNEIDKYNMSSDLYNNICYTLTSDSGTDMSLKDRQEEYIINGNLSICEENCNFSQYDEKIKKAVCSCYTKIKLPIVSEIKFDKKMMIYNFKNIKNIGNFKFLKCYYLLFDKSNIFLNSGIYIVEFLSLISIISLFHFCCRAYKNTKNILIKISNEIKQEQDNRNKVQNLNKINVMNNIKKNKDKKPQKNIILNKNKKFRKQDKGKNNQIFNINLNPINNLENKSNKKKILKLKSKKIENKSINNKKIKENNRILNLKNNFKNGNLNSKSQKKESFDNILNLKILNSLNDTEINSLKYEEAKKIDNRTYSEYYISLLRSKHILLFTFFQHNDYNSQLIKIYIFFFIFSINYFVSAMFYSDDTLHKIYVDEGSFDFTYQLPKMFYSFIISTVLKSLLNILGLYEQNIITFKADKKYDLKTQKNVLFKIKCKILFFFVITDILLIFFLIYLGCFCAVYKNTQTHLLLNVSSSFCISFISPFFIYLLPGIFRLSSLKNKANKPLLYKFSKLLQLL